MIDLIIFVALLGLGYGFGSYAEKKHFKYIKEKESELNDVVVLSKYDAKQIALESGELLTGNIVISIDFFKKFIAGFINFFGGRISSYESLLDRARRDVIVKVGIIKKNVWLK